SLLDLRSLSSIAFRPDHPSRSTLFPYTTLFRSYVLICSTLSTTDPIVIDALRRAELPSSDSVNVAYRSHSGRRSKDERNALDAAGVPRSRTYGYGRKQFENHGWSGYGCVVDLKSSEYSEAEAREWLTFA